MVLSNGLLGLHLVITIDDDVILFWWVPYNLPVYVIELYAKHVKAISIFDAGKEYICEYNFKATSLSDLLSIQ